MDFLTTVMFHSPYDRSALAVTVIALFINALIDLSRRRREAPYA